MEEINKKLKYWLPKDGVPSNEVWKQTIRSLENIETVKFPLRTDISYLK